MLNSHPYLLAIGGGMELSHGSPLVKKFIELSGDNSVITILPTASEIGVEVGEMYKNFFSEYSDDVEYFIIEKRIDTDNDELIDRLSKSTAIFFTGGNQLRITSLLGGSRVMDEVRKAMDRNIIIAGTSAGASAMSDPMISWGEADRITKGQLHLAPGMGLIKHKMVIDSHFIKRGRMSRLLHVVSQHPGTLGIGIAEDTGCLFECGKDYFEVIGSRNVIVVNGRGIKHTNIADIGEGLPYTVTNVRVDALGPLYTYNYRNFEVIIPEKLEETLKIKIPEKVAELPYRPVKEMSE